MPKGNPNPSPETRFKPGVSGNPSGRSTEEQIAHKKAAQIAAELKLRAVSCLQDKVSGDLTDDELIELLFNPDAQRMFKEVEDRAHGTPKATNELSGPNGGSIPVSKVEYAIYDPVKDAD